MFTILMSHFNEDIKQELKEICSIHGHIHILEGKNADELLSLATGHAIDCFLFCLDKDLPSISKVISDLRETETYAHIPIFLFSSQIEYLVSAFVHWKTCEFFLLPMGNNRKAMLADLIKYYDRVYQKMHLLNDTFHCRISTTKGVYNIPYDDIFFVESTMKKSVLHTKNGIISLPLPLYRVREILPNTLFAQTHRSFIINLKNASYIDKTKDPWVISFFDYEKAAYVSRNYKKDLIQTVTPFLDCTLD